MADPQSTTYEAFSESLQARADAAFAEWIGGLTGEDLRVALAAAGVSKTEILGWATVPPERKARLLRGAVFADGHADVGMDQDVAATAWELAAPDYDTQEDWAEVLMEELGLPEEQARAAARWDEERMEAEARAHEHRLLEAVMCRLTAAANPRIAAVAMAFALSVPLVRVATWVEGQRVLRECRTQMQAAAALLTSRQNLSKEVRKALRFLGAKQNMHSKRPHEVESFRSAQRGNHWRRRVFSRSCEHGRRGA